MRVREWIERLSEMNPDWEVCATKEGAKEPPVPVQPIEAQDTSSGVGMMSHGPYCRVVKD